MYNLYFKLDDDNLNIYMKTMQYMTTINSEGKEIVELYDPEKFILVEEYFKNKNYSLAGDCDKQTHQPVDIVKAMLQEKLALASTSGKETNKELSRSIKRLEMTKTNKSGK